MAVVLKSENIVLRPANITDVAGRLVLGYDTEIVEMFGVSRNDFKAMTHDEAKRWVHDLIKHPTAWVIEVSDKLIGEIRLDEINHQDRRASMAIGIYDSEALGRGLGSEAISLVLQYSFAVLKLHRIGVRVLTYNQRAIRAYEKCGFVVEGRERETAFVNGAWHDDVMMGILDREFLSDKGQT